MSYGAGARQNPSSGIGNIFRDSLVFYDPDLTSETTQGTDFGSDGLTFTLTLKIGDNNLYSNFIFRYK